MTEQEKREKVIKGLECCATNRLRREDCEAMGCVYLDLEGHGCIHQLIRDALALLKAQMARHKLEVHNIGNVDIPEGVPEEQFYAVMSNVVDALEHTDRGEAWPYDSEGVEVG